MGILSCKQIVTSERQSSSPMRLDSIPGIGKKYRLRILDYYQTEEAALEAIKLGAVGCVPGITFKQGLRFAQAYFKLQEDISLEDVMKTNDISDIYIQVINLIKEYAQTDYSKLKLQQYFPLPSSKIHIIQERQEYFRKALVFAQQYHEKLEDQHISKLCNQLNTIKEAEDLPKIKSRIILTDSKSVQELIKTEELQERAHFEVLNIDTVTDVDRFFKKYVQNFDVVLYCGTNTHKIPDFSNLIIVSPHEVSVTSLIPELVIRAFAYNKSLIQAMVKIVVLLKGLRDTSLISEFTPEFDLRKIKTLKQNSKILNDLGEILPGIDPKLDELREINREFLSYISETEAWINQQIQKEIGERSINIEGKQILDLMRTDIDIKQIRNYIPPEVDNLIEESIHQGIDKLGNQLKLDKYDRELLNELLPELIGYPVELDPQKTDELEKKISARANTYKYTAMVEIAKELNDTYEYFLKLHQSLLEFDFFYMIGKFALDYKLAIPSISNSHRGFYGKDMLNLFLQRDFLINKEKTLKPIPITYQLGNIGQDQHPERHASTLSLLTGSNSGGKTMCILTCAQSLILAQMGFPCPGEFEFYPYNEIYYYKKSSGQLSAGAFETTLLQFVELAQSVEPKIVFTDELESITEPNAASKVLAGIFSLFLDNSKNFGVFVTHLADLLQKEMSDHQKKKIRIDGIEAKGLDEHLNLIVDRNPKFNFIAKSTPEFILTRLSKSGSQNQQEFFHSILKKFTV